MSKPTNPIEKDNSYYWNIMDERTGVRYNIPMLNPLDPDYFYSYIYYMKIKEGSPRTFERIINWD